MWTVPETLHQALSQYSGKGQTSLSGFQLRHVETQRRYADLGGKLVQAAGIAAAVSIRRTRQPFRRATLLYAQPPSLRDFAAATVVDILPLTVIFFVGSWRYVYLRIPLLADGCGDARFPCVAAHELMVYADHVTMPLAF